MKFLISFGRTDCLIHTPHTQAGRIYFIGQIYSSTTEAKFNRWAYFCVKSTLNSAENINTCNLDFYEATTKY